MSSSEQEKPHKRLLAWQRSMDLFVEIHRLTPGFPNAERYLTSQIRGAALAAPSNIAEGAADQSRDQFRAFLGYAIRSLNEVETQLEGGRHVELVSDQEAARIAALNDETRRLPSGLKRSR